MIRDEENIQKSGKKLLEKLGVWFKFESGLDFLISAHYNLAEFCRFLSIGSKKFECSVLEKLERNTVTHVGETDLSFKFESGISRLQRHLEYWQSTLIQSSVFFLIQMQKLVLNGSKRATRIFLFCRTFEQCVLYCE